MQRLLKMGVLGMVKSDLAVSITGECVLATCRVGEEQHRYWWSAKAAPPPTGTPLPVSSQQNFTSALLEVSCILSPVDFTVWHWEAGCPCLRTLPPAALAPQCLLGIRHTSLAPRNDGITSYPEEQPLKCTMLTLCEGMADFGRKCALRQ